MILLLLHTASAISVRHDVADSEHTDLAQTFEAVGHIGGCTATLIAPDVVLTAAHCFDDDGDGEMDRGRMPEGFFLGPSWDATDSAHEIADFTLHPDRTRQTREKWDVAVITLVEPIDGIQPIPLASADPVGEEVVIVGYGGTGTGEDADYHSEDAYDGLKRAAWNTIDGRDEGPGGIGTFLIDFDAPDGSVNAIEAFYGLDSSATPLALEGTTGPGDSGGPMLLQRDGQWQVVGVASAGGNPLSETWSDELAGQYGSIGEHADVTLPETAAFLATFLADDSDDSDEATTGPDDEKAEPSAGCSSASAPAGLWVLALPALLAVRQRRSLLVLLPAWGCASPVTVEGAVPLVPASPAQSCADDDIILETPKTGAHSRYHRKGFDRMVALEAPNGAAIRIYAQDQVEDAQMMRALSLLRHYLTDAPGTRYGADKTAVANAMADNSAALMMPNGAHEEGNEPLLPAQSLYADETPVEGHPWYMDNDYAHRDAAFEEIFHLVHDNGIGTNQPAALPDYQQELLAEGEAAIEDGRWGASETDWIRELRREGSIAQEYIAAVLDSSMGLWAPWTEDEGGMWGIYVAKDRAAVQELDPAGWSLLMDFLSPTVTSEIRLHPDFDGTFSMQLDPTAPYTHKSQYLQHVTLTGTADAGLLGNDLDNQLRGNTGDNDITGGGGIDTVIYCQPSDAYTVTDHGDHWTVDGPDGLDTLREIEAIAFEDGQTAL